jgi:isoquinoline 1-oxidoreductase beta subunit
MPTRRRFLLGTVGAAGALVVGWSLLPPRQRLRTASPLPAPAGERALNGWVRISRDDIVTVMTPKSEMGQGIHTALAMLLAEELDADWTRIRVEHPPIDRIYANLATAVDGLPFHPDDDGLARRVAGWLTAKAMREFGLMLTGGSSSVKDLWGPMRQAGAAARAMLVQAAAAQWAVPAAEIAVDEGRLSHPSGRQARFGDMVDAAAALRLPADAPLKDPTRFRLIGRDTRRLEARAKVEGSATFGIDVLLPGMLHATVKMCPTLGGRVRSFDDRLALAMRGVHRVFPVEGYNGGTAGVAVIADTPWHALKALDAVTVTWDEAVPAAGIDSDEVLVRLTRRLDDPAGHVFHAVGDPDAALSGAIRVVRADYTAPYLAHAPMEPVNCTVQVREGRATVWAGTQVPDVARRAAARALGVDEDRVDVRVQFIGGGFGRRLDVDFIGQAAAIARQAPEGVPVQTFWSREQDITHDLYRPACAARFTAGLDADGRVVAITVKSAGQAIVPMVIRRYFDLPVSGPDKTTSEGSFDQPYEWPAARIRHELVELPVPVAFWRSVGHSHQAFFKECFVDELAAAANADPVAFRLGLLARHPRHARVLRRAAEAAGWGQDPGAASDGAPIARGVALHQSFGSIVAQVAEVSLRADRRIRVHRVVCAIDCGIAVNPDHVRQQMESGIVFGLSAALHGSIDIDRGRVRQSNFHDYPCLRLEDCPTIETHILPSAAHPEGVGEPGTPPIAPAVANALHVLTGRRLRSLPLRPD